MKCALCHKEIPLETPARQIAKQVVGWKAPAGSLVRMKLTGSVAHLACVNGGVGEQQPLWS